jgi:hypothetical protein
MTTCLASSLDEHSPNLLLEPLDKHSAQPKHLKLAENVSSLRCHHQRVPTSPATHLLMLC